MLFLKYNLKFTSDQSKQKNIRKYGFEPRKGHEKTNFVW